MPTETGFNDDTAIGPRYERFKFKDDEQNKRKRIAFISKKVLKENVHYFDNWGYSICLQSVGHECPACNKGMRTTHRFATVVLEYYTDMDGAVSKPFGYTVKAFVFGNGKGNGTFSILHGVHKTLGDKMYSQDCVVSCMNPKYQALSFLPTGDCALLELAKVNKAAFDEIKADYTKKMEEMDLMRVLAPSVTAEVMQQVIDGKIVRRSAKNQATNETADSSAVTTTSVASPASAPPKASVPAATQPVVQTPAVSATEAGKVEEAKNMMKEISL